MSDRSCAPAAIATWSFGRIATRAGGPILAGGGAALDAVETGINAVELDASVLSVGFGGLPNARGEVELDAMIMQGAGLACGAVAALTGIATPISVARRVMEASRHTFLAGPGARAFAEAQGFETRDLLTPASRKRWARWLDDPGRVSAHAHRWVHDTVGMVALDERRRLSAGCSTSGFPFKEPGRVGDSPIIGAGAYCDDAVGGAAATGSGDSMMRFCLSFAAVEAMRAGSGARAACEVALDRMRAVDPGAEAAVIALDREGDFGAAVIGRDEFAYAVWAPGLEEMRAIAPRADRVESPA